MRSIEGKTTWRERCAAMEEAWNALTPAQQANLLMLPKGVTSRWKLHGMTPTCDCDALKWFCEEVRATEPAKWTGFYFVMCMKCKAEVRFSALDLVEDLRTSFMKCVVEGLKAVGK